MSERIANFLKSYHAGGTTALFEDTDGESDYSIYESAHEEYDLRALASPGPCVPLPRTSTLSGTRPCVPLSALVIMPKDPRALTAASRR
jgi:hypothetical protein